MSEPESASRRAPRWPWIAGVATVLVLVVAGFVFKPWLLFVDDVVDEDVPTVATQETAATQDEVPSPSDSGGSESPTTGPAEDPEPTGPVELASGTFISHEHGTEGIARVLQLEDGSRVLVLEDLETSNGPALEVWLTDQPVIEGRDGWGVFDDGEWTSLGPLTGNIGTQQYEVPDDLDLSTVTSVSIWCEQFSVSFGAAELDLG